MAAVAVDFLSLSLPPSSSREGVRESSRPVACNIQQWILQRRRFPPTNHQQRRRQRSPRARASERRVMFIAEFLTKRDNSSLKVTRLKSIFTKCSFYFANRSTVKYTISNGQPARRPLLFCKNITRKRKTGLTGKISKRGPIKLICLRCRSTPVVKRRVFHHFAVAVSHSRASAFASSRLTQTAKRRGTAAPREHFSYPPVVPSIRPFVNTRVHFLALTPNAIIYFSLSHLFRACVYNVSLITPTCFLPPVRRYARFSLAGAFSSPICKRQNDPPPFTPPLSLSPALSLYSISKLPKKPSDPTTTGLNLGADRGGDLFCPPLH